MRFYKRTLLLSFLLAVVSFVFFSSSGIAQLIDVANDDMQFDELLVHGNSAVPARWKGNGSPSGIRIWNSPGSPAVALGAGSSISQTIILPPISEKLANATDWRLVLAVDVTGKFVKSDRDANVWVAIKDKRGKDIRRDSFVVKNDAPVSKVAVASVSASSFKANNGVPGFAFDGDHSTHWHSDWGKTNAPFPHHLTFDFGEIKTLRGLQYVPRSSGGNGTLKKFEIQVFQDGKDWNPVFQGEFSYAKTGEVQTVVLAEPVQCRAFRLKCLSAIHGEVFASCAELIPDLVEGFDGLPAGQQPEPRPVAQRLFVPLSFQKSKNLQKVTVSIGVDSNRFVVVDRVQLFRVPQNASQKLCGKANGHAGPDLLGAGSYGFKGLMIHKYPALPIIEIRKGSPASKAKLRESDLIVGVNDRFLPAGNVNPSFEWFENSHESILGRAALDAVGSNDGKVLLTVLRDDKLINVELKLALPSEIAEDDFLVDLNRVSTLTDDLIKHVERTQREDGSWKKGPIHTCLGGLALLSTHDKKHARQIKAAANWLMAQNAEPGVGFYWHPAFSGIFLCEYYLATGDERALPVIERLLALMGSAFHTSKWGTETFGHGPKGLPYGNKSLVAVIVHVLVFEALAKRCGIEDSELFERLAPFIESAWSAPTTGGHGALGYNASYKDLGEFWSRSGLMGLALHLRSDRQDMQDAMSKVMYERHPWFRNSHAYGEPGGLLGLIGLSQMNPDYFDETISKYRWWFALAWEKNHGLHFTIPHMGAPYMEGPQLINNGYAIVCNIHKKSLHITGSLEKNWLDVSKIHVPISDPMILLDPEGMISMRCRIPGPAIFYTTDGSQPSRKSRRFKAPFPVEAGGIVKAVAVQKKPGKTLEISAVVSREFGLDKSNWKIVSANGHLDEAKSMEQAASAIDGDNFICWVTDAGEVDNQYPFRVAIDLGESRALKFATVRFLAAGAAASRVTVEASDSSETGFRQTGSDIQEDFSKEVRVELDSSGKTRFLRFTFDSPFVEKNRSLLMVAEIDAR